MPFETRSLHYMHRYTAVFLAAVATLAVGCRTTQPTTVDVVERPDPVVVETPEVRPGVPADDQEYVIEPGRFDYGKLWTFDNPPLEYFEEAYAFTPDSAWFDHARLGALRFADYCSASFVSASGLILTNNHCGRESVEEVTRSGEDLLENGFYAPTRSDERQVPELFVDQLISIEDVTPRITQGLDRIQDVERRAQLRSSRVEELEEQLTADAQRQDSSLVVEIVSLYQGGRFAAYTFRRYDDVRLVMSTEHSIGYFGGDYDNFTYPRYNLDYAFFRAYDDDQPVEPAMFFRWSENGASEGEAVFVVGSPGSTSRLNTVAQLEYERDHELPVILDALRARAEILDEYIEAHPEEAEEHQLRSTYLSITNQIKSQSGQLGGLRDPDLIARRRGGERELLDRLNQSDSLRQRYGDVIEQIADLQQTRRSLARRAAAFTAFGSILDSQVLTRSLYGYIHSLMRQRGIPQEAQEEIRESARETEFYPAGLEERLLAARLHDLRTHLGATDPTIARILQQDTPEAVAQRVIAGTALTDSARTEELFDDGFMGSGDAAVPLIEALGPAYMALAQQINTLAAREEALVARLAQARFAVYGDSIPPDASFSLRIADGVVAGYPYNGTVAPAITTFAGLYDRHFSFLNEEHEDWNLPDRWLDRRGVVDLSTPMNIVTTNDITGGNSGSPMLNRDLEIVGLVFDSNIDALPNDYIYLDYDQRAISVDSRGILESLRVIYEADALVEEIEQGVMAVTAP